MTEPTMTTDPAGLCFISYRRSRVDEIRRLVAALHDHGVPTWQDLTSLDEEPLEPALRHTIAGPGVASGILWITPEVADSAVITGVEIPALLARAHRGDAFFLVPVAAGGLDFDGAARAANAPTTLDDLRSWSIDQVHDDPIGDIEAATIARRVLTRRIKALHAALPDGAPLVVDIYTFSPVVRRADAALTIDLTHHFNGRHANTEAWQTTILPAFDAIVEVIASQARGRLIQLRGLASLTAAVAMGTTLLAPRQIPAAWMQYTDGRPDSPYSLAAERHPSGFTVTIHDQVPGAADLAVLININENTAPAIRATTGLPEFRGRIEANPPSANRYFFPGPGEAVDLAYEVVDMIRAARRRYGPTGEVHLFMAAPAGFAFLLGQLLNTLGPIHTYEHVSDHIVGHYRPAATIRPSG